MGGDHLESSNGNDLAFFIYERDNNWQTIEFCKVFLLDFEFLSIEFDNVVNVLSSLDENFLMLPCEHFWHILDIMDMLRSGSGQLCKLEIIIAEDHEKEYLQKNFLVGKLVQPLKLTPSTM